MAFFGDMVEGFGKGQEFRKNYYLNAKLAEEAKRYGAKLDMEQKMLGYKTGIAGTQNQYLPDEMKFANEHAALVNKYYGPNIQSEIQNRQANTASTQADTKYKPLNELIKAQASSNSAKRFGASYELRQQLASASPAFRADWISKNQDAYNDMLTNIANGNKQPGGITPEVIAKFFPEMGITTPQPGVPQPSPAAANAMPVLPGGLQADRPMPPMNGMQPPSIYPQQQSGIAAHPMMQQGASPQAPPMMQGQLQPQGGIGAPMMQQPYPQQAQPQGQPFAPMTPEQNQELKHTSEMAANQYLTTAATRRQMEGAIQVEQIVNSPEVLEQVKDAALYAGAAGRGKAALAALSQTNPKAYENYIAFTHQTMPLIDNRIKTLDQMGSTDKQREEIHGLRDKTMDALSSNPKQFVIQYNKLVKALDVVARAVQKSASPVANVNRLEGPKPIPEGNMVQVKLPDGRMGNIPASNLDAAIKMGAKKVS